MSRRITDKKAGRLIIFMNRTPAPWDTLKSSVKVLIQVYLFIRKLIYKTFSECC